MIGMLNITAFQATAFIAIVISCAATASLGGRIRVNVAGLLALLISVILYGYLTPWDIRIDYLFLVPLMLVSIVIGVSRILATLLFRGLRTSERTD